MTRCAAPPEETSAQPANQPSAGVAQPAGDPVDGEKAHAPELLGVDLGPFAPAPQELHLHERKRVDERIATIDRGLQDGLAVEQLLAAADRDQLGDGEL